MERNIPQEGIREILKRGMATGIIEGGVTEIRGEGAEGIREAVNGILNKYGIHEHTIEEETLLVRAFTHHSVTIEESYEKLAFLGDAILNLVISSYICNRFVSLSEDSLRRLRSKTQVPSLLAKLSKVLGIDRFAKFSVRRTVEVESIHNDIFKSFIGTVYTLLGVDVCTRLVTAIIERHINTTELIEEQYITKSLEQNFDKLKIGAPSYRLSSTTNGRCKIKVTNGQKEVYGVGYGATIEIAKKEAIHQSLKLFDLGDLPLGIF